VDVEIKVPVIPAFHPGSDDKIHAAVGELDAGYRRGRILQNMFIGIDDIPKYAFNLVDVVTEADACNQIYAPDLLRRVVDDVVVRDPGVWENNLRVVGGLEIGCKNIDLLHGACRSFTLNIISHLEGLENDHERAGKANCTDNRHEKRWSGPQSSEEPL
jgi:hypothetical protein